MVLCRECERLLVRVRDVCPSCSARRPGARVHAAPGARRLELWLVAPAVTAPTLVAGELAVRWLLSAG